MNNETKRLELLNKMKNLNGYQKRNERIKQGNNFEVTVDDNGHLHSTSYRWWAIVTNKNGLYLFNNYGYSSSTSKHQSKMWRIMSDLGLDYISVAYQKDLDGISLETILSDKIKSLYDGENRLSVSRATKYSVYSESEFNSTMTDIKAIAQALKLSDTNLNKMLVDAELKATETLILELADKHDKQVERRALQKMNDNLNAISL